MPAGDAVRSPESASSGSHESRFRRTAERIAPLLVVVVFGTAVWLLFHELKQYRIRDIRDAIAAIPASRLLAAMALTALNYVILIGYDWIAIRSIGHDLPLKRVSLASFTGFVTSYNFGALLGGTTVRYRLYSAWGFSTVEILRMVVMLGVTFWFGIFALAGVVFLVDPFPLPEKLHLPFDTVRPLGFILLGLAIGYVALTAAWHRPLKIRGLEIRLPGVRTTLLQLAVSAADLTVAAACLYVLLPNGLGMGYWEFLGVYLLAIVAVIITHVPGGVGVFELVVLTMAAAQTNEATVAALLAFRVIYYLLPLLMAMTLLAVNEYRMGHGKAFKAVAGLARWTSMLAPPVLSLLTLLAGALLLWSGATPVMHARIGSLERIIPLPLVESSHFIGSISGACLLLLARGLQRRLDSAFWMTVGLIGIGVVVSLLKGFDWEESLLLLALLAALLSCRRQFFRRGSLLHQPFATRWTAAILLAVLCSLWLGFFAFRHVEYSHDLWWQFAFRADAPRFLRASVGAVAVLLIFSLWRLIRGVHPPAMTAAVGDLAAVESIVRSDRNTAAALALVGDKQFLFNEQRNAFVMYAVQGRSWIAMGDPIGPDGECRELVWEFRELADRHDGRPVFYQVDTERLADYLDAGLTLQKLGEEARVPLTDFSLDGSGRKGLRQSRNRCLREHCSFEIIPAERVEELLPELRAVSDAWLEKQHGSEKGFSLGSFSDDYVRRFPCAVVRRDGKIIAFANIWLGADREEMSIDLMRYLPARDTDHEDREPPRMPASTPAVAVAAAPAPDTHDDTICAPPGVMEFVFTELMLWGHAEGYAWFNLGMAPFSGIESRRLAPIWNRMAGLVFRHGDHFYSFEGLRNYKEKFDPVWKPKYLASPGGFALPGILRDLTALISKDRDP